MMEIMNWVTANQYLLMIVVVCAAWVANAYIQYRAKANPGFDAWDEWAPRSQTVTNLVFQGAEWYGKVKAQSGDQKLKLYLEKLKEFEKDFSEDRIRAVQKLIAWYLSIKAKIQDVAPNPLIETRPIGPDDPAVQGSTSR